MSAPPSAVASAALSYLAFDIGTRRVGVATRQLAEDMLATPNVPPGGADRAPRDHLAPHRHDLLTEQDAEQADQRDHRRSRRPDVEEAVDDADQEAGAE